jgi:hypothetical protein
MKMLFAAMIFLTTAALMSSCATPKTSTTAATPAVITNQGEQKPVSLKIISPIANEVLKNPDVPVTFELSNYQIQPDGQHIHVILDNEPYQPCYSLAEPFILKGLKPGVHTIRAFPARAWHESIKDPDAFAAVTFFVKRKSGKAPVDFNKDPLLTYSRPKGKYEGAKAEKILFDFWVKNTQIASDENQVRYKLDNDDTKIISSWKPAYFENLPSGKHILVIDLVDKNGQPVTGAYNHTKREFEVSK